MTGDNWPVLNDLDRSLCHLSSDVSILFGDVGSFSFLDLSSFFMGGLFGFLFDRHTASTCSIGFLRRRTQTEVTCTVNARVQALLLDISVESFTYNVSISVPLQNRG